MTVTNSLPIKKLLIANRSEIAIRISRACHEMGIRTVAVYSREDRFALHRFKADEAYEIGQGTMAPLECYLSIDEMIRIAKDTNCDAVHPGYGFLSENPDFADRCEREGIIFVGPTGDTMRSLGNKVAARNIAVQAGVPVIPASDPLPRDMDEIKKIAEQVGFPIMLKASWGGGGRGMRTIESLDDVAEQVTTARKEAESAFGNDEIYFERLIRRARHVEVQIMGDEHGNLVHMFERDCTVQRRNQKVVERAPAPYLNEETRQKICESALKIGRHTGYRCAGTVEFLMDFDSGEYFFIEVNPRVQVEHTVTETITGIDIVQSQIHLACGRTIGDDTCPVPTQDNITMNGHAVQCRITTENPANNFIPDYGRITAYRSATGFGIRLDGGTAYNGAVITPFYDSLLVKVTAWAPTAPTAINRMQRALNEFRIRGVATNLPFLSNLLQHDDFLTDNYTTKFIDSTPALFDFPKRRDRATRLLTFIGDTIVNGNPEVAGRKQPDAGIIRYPQSPAYDMHAPIPTGTRDVFLEKGAEGFVQWLRDQKQPMLTDTSMRDAHQSLLATRFRTYDLETVAPAYARLMPNLFSVECWGGATFDVSMRFLKECPWDRLEKLREAMPNQMLQMLLRASNAVGYTNYPDNVVQYFIEHTAQSGLDVFRIFDSLNWVENMKFSIDAVLKTGKIAETAICYTADMYDPERDKYNLEYYLNMAQELKSLGAHIIAIKDMAGLCKPQQAHDLVSTIKRETGMPVHFHTHDTSGMAGATLLSAINAGADVVDCAMDSLSGNTSQPNLGSLVESLRHTAQDTGINGESVRQISGYWEQVRKLYTPFESDMRSGASEVYLHEMPGGQFTNLKEQARSLGINDDEWHKVAHMYAEVNKIFGDIVKVTPSSKVVGDMAIMMVSSGITIADVLDPNKEIAFPESVVALFRGDLGQPTGGFPPALQRKILKNEKPYTDRPGAVMAPLDLEQERDTLHKKHRHKIHDNLLASHLMYPAVFDDYTKHRQKKGDVSVIPTHTFFYGMDSGEEINIAIEKGKNLIVRFDTVSGVNAKGERQVFFELNGQPRIVTVADNTAVHDVTTNQKADEANPNHVPSPMPGMIAKVTVSAGDTVQKGDQLLTIEAMKMLTSLNAERDGVIETINVATGDVVEAKDLLMVYKDE